jgi:hypothetical protein
MKRIDRSEGAPVTRRTALGAFAAGAGALLLGGVAHAEDESSGEQRISWDDGWEHPIVGSDESGHWIVDFDDAEYTVDPSGWIFDDGAWYPISAVGAEGIWYIGNDGYEYLVDGFDSAIEFLV